MNDPMNESKRVLPDILEQFASAVLRAAGARADVASHVAAGLVSTSARGVDSHGIRLLPHYVAGLAGGRINPNPTYGFEQTGPATGRFDADHTFGHAAGVEAMHRAMALAAGAGVGWVEIRHTSHTGAAACAALEAARRDFIGFCFVHADSLTKTPGSIRSFFGTNPFCMVAPCDGEEPFCYDGSQVRMSFNRVLQLRAEHMPVPPGIGAGVDGRETSDPDAVTQLLPIGDYKGFGVAMVIDILCGLLSGMAVGRDITNMFKDPLSARRNLGQVVIALDVARFVPVAEFKARLKALMDAVRAEPRRDPGMPILVPNDPEKRAAAERHRDGVPFKPHEFEALMVLSRRYGVALDAVGPGTAHAV